MYDEFYVLKLFTESIKIRQVFIMVLPILISLIVLRSVKNKLPLDRGKGFVKDGVASRGKPTAAGIALFFSFAISFLIVGTVEVKWFAFISLMFLEMLTGFFDDKSLVPWNEFKKAIIDIVICFLVAVVFNVFSYHELSLLIIDIESSSMMGYMVITVFLWCCINSFNCCDGIDGLSGSLAINSLLFIGAFSFHLSRVGNQLIVVSLMIMILIFYLWFNSENSTLLMGDAGSRFIGLLLGILILETGQLWIAIPFSLSIILDGFPGLIKILIIKIFNRNIIRIRLPLHDYLRNDLEWSKTKIVTRLNIVQSVAGTLALILHGFFVKL